MRRIKTQDLLLVSKATKEKLDSFAAGISLKARTRKNIPALLSLATRDRLAFAQLLLRSAQSNAVGAKPAFRSAISRAYYAMYHCLRAVCYYVYCGDDHEKHSILPSKIPSDFPNRDDWENELKNARFERNRADYDPYPRDDKQFRLAALDVIVKARTLIPVAIKYLRGKGCRL